MNRHCIPGLTMSNRPRRESWECPGIIKTMHTGFSVHGDVMRQRPVLTMEETGRYDLAWKDLCSVLNALK